MKTKSMVLTLAKEVAPSGPRNCISPVDPLVYCETHRHRDGDYREGDWLCEEVCTGGLICGIE